MNKPVNKNKIVSSTYYIKLQTECKFFSVSEFILTLPNLPIKTPKVTNEMIPETSK